MMLIHKMIWIRKTVLNLKNSETDKIIEKMTTLRHKF